MKVFVAGSIAIKRLNEQIKNRLENIIASNYDIVVGDANGADKAIQKYLDEKQYKNVSVYCSGDACRNNIGNWKELNISVPKNLSGRKYYMVKDLKMASDSDYGFMLWDGKSSGTLSNSVELLKMNKSTLVYFSPENSFYTISSVDDIKELLKKCDDKSISTINRKINIDRSITQLDGDIQTALNF